MSRRFVVAAALVAALMSGGAAKPSPVKPLMKTVVDPAANVLFAVGGEVDPANGPEAAATPAGRWSAAAAAARKLEASAARLQKPPMAKTQKPWKTYTAQFAKSAAAAEAAAMAHDGAKLSQAANDLSDTCSACHGKYKPQT